MPSGARYRIVIISACYSGAFTPVLANISTLVITAAAADRPSFGCEDGAKVDLFRACVLQPSPATAVQSLTIRSQKQNG